MKKKSKGKIVMTVVIVVLVLAAAQLIVLGARGGIGPLKFLKDNRMAKLPGNAEEYHIENVEPLESSPLAGKRLLFLGSSVTNGSAAMRVSVADYIRVLDSCDVVKEAVNGTTLADKGSSSYLSRLKALDPPQQFDAVVCQLSTNDASQNISLGEVSGSKDPADFDTQTVIGSMEAIIAYCQETWNCPVVIYTGTKYDSDAYQAMVDSLPQLQEKWGVSVVDLWNDEEMNGVSSEDYAFYMSDNIHPTQAGYLLWWTPKFQEVLYALFS